MHLTWRNAFLGMALGILGGFGIVFGGLQVAALTQGEHGPWPGSELRVYNAGSYPVSLQRALRRWNATGLALHLRQVEDRRSAQVVVEDVRAFSGRCAGQGVAGCAPVGYQAAGSWVQVRAPESAARDRGAMTMVIMHELGHVLGLPHRDDGCRLMNAVLCEEGHRSLLALHAGCPVRRSDGVDPGDWCPGTLIRRDLCGPTRAEVQQLIDRYGGRLPQGYSAWCVQHHRQAWLGGCGWPQWRPGWDDWLPLDGPRGVCTAQAPRWAWYGLRERQKALVGVPATPAAWSRYRLLRRLATHCPVDQCLSPGLYEPRRAPVAR